MALLSTVQELTAEFVGTFLLIFTVGCNVLGGNTVWGGVSIACVLMVCIYSFGAISGANFNPAVSFGLGLSKYFGANGMEWQKVGEYSAVQILAGICASGCYTVLWGSSFALGPAKGFSWGNCALVELLYTFVLVFVVLNVAAAKKYDASGPPHFFGLAIGFVIVAGAYGGGAISGGCFNPAVAIAINVSSLLTVPFITTLKWGLVYVLAQIVGAAFAVQSFYLCRPGDFGVDTEAERPLVPSRPEFGNVDPKQVAYKMAELKGTFVLVLTVGLNVLANSPAAAFSIAASLMCMIYALGDVSGAHFNPAVSLAIFIGGKLKFCPEMDPKELGHRMLNQFAGALVAGIFFATAHNGGTFPLGPKPGYNWASVAVAEIIFTMVLCMVVLAVAVSPKTKSESMFGLAIGSCVTVGGFAIGGVSGGSLNPAVSLSIGLTHLGGAASWASFGAALIYTLFEFIGAGLAAGLVSFTHGSLEATSKAEEKQTA